MDTQIDPQKVLAALEAEKAKRIAAKAEAGDVIVIPAEPFIAITGTRDEAPDIEDIKASLLAEAKVKYPGKAVVVDESRIIVVITGVPRAGDPEPDHRTTPTTCDGDKWGDYAGAPTHTTSQGRSCDLASEVSVSEPQPLPETPARSQFTPLTRVWVTTRPGNEETGDPGAIEEGFYTILDDVLVLRDRDGFQIAEATLRVDDDPDCVARALLSRATAGSDFNRPLPYQPLSIA